MLPFSWRAFAELIKEHSPVLAEFKTMHTPSYGSLYLAWREVNEQKLLRLICGLGKRLCKDPKHLAADSTGMLFKGGAIWILLKWHAPNLKKTSKAFRKVHIIVSTCCQAILAIHVSKATKADIVALPTLLKLLGKKTLLHSTKLYGDKAYTSQVVQKELWKEYATRFVVEPKRNAVPNAELPFDDLALYLHSPKLWKYTLGYSRKTFVELAFAAAHRSNLPLSARKNSEKRKQILCRFFLLNWRKLFEKQKRW